VRARTCLAALHRSRDGVGRERRELFPRVKVSGVPCVQRSSVATTVVAHPFETSGTGNPYTELLYDSLRARGVHVVRFDRRSLLKAPSIVHVHWPEFMVSRESRRAYVRDAIKLLLLLRWARLRGTILVWTGHNLRPHERRFPTLDHFYMKMFCRQVDVLLTLTAASRTCLTQAYPALERAQHAVTLHGSYKGTYRQLQDKGQVRQRLGIPAERAVLLVLGQVRPYKNLEPMIAEFRSNATDEVSLAIAGEPSGPELATRLRLAAAESLRIHLDLHRLSKTEVADWVAGCDALAALHDSDSVLNSGAAILALSFDRPVLLQHSPGNAELQQRLGVNWVRLLHPGDSVPAELKALLALPRTAPALGPEFDWREVAAATERAYRLGRRRKAISPLLSHRRR
jgi:beta-1,4-mannosyltransferase